MQLVFINEQLTVDITKIYSFAIIHWSCLWQYTYLYVYKQLK